MPIVKMCRAVWLSILFERLSALTPDMFTDEAEALSLLQHRAHTDLDANRTDVAPLGINVRGCRGRVENAVRCSFSGDTHMQSRFALPHRPDFHLLGLYEAAKAKDNSFEAQIFQCPWHRIYPAAAASGLALRIGENVIEFLRNTNCGEVVGGRTEPISIVNGERVRFSDFPMTLDDGTFIAAHKPDMMQFAFCIDTADGSTVANVAYASWACDRITDSSNFLMDLLLPADQASTDDGTMCGQSAPNRHPSQLTEGMQKVDLASGASLFSRASHESLCSSCHWGNFGPCEHPPPPPPPPPNSQVACEEAKCPYDRAQELCASLESHEVSYENCLNDVCMSCEDNEMMVVAADELVAAEEQENPGPCCVDAGSKCGLPADTCSASVKMNMFQMAQNNLGGLGPDEGAEEIRFSKAAAINGQLVDLVIKQSGGNYLSNNPGKNGKSKSGAFGNINLKAKHDVDLEFSFEDSTSGTAVTVEDLSITFYDIDEGKRGKSRSTLTACGADNVVVTTDSELTLDHAAGCYKISSSTHGTAADNPTSASTLSALQASRTATFVFSDASKVYINYQIGKGFGARNVHFLVEPTLPCMEGYDEAMPCTLEHSA